MSAIRGHASSVLCLFLVVLFFLFSQWCEISYGDESLPTGRESLIDKYHKIEKELGKSPFDIMQNELQVPTNWCEIVLPQLSEEFHLSKRAHPACISSASFLYRDLTPCCFLPSSGKGDTK
jgi:hypothetical protein